jgi:ubiquinone/menaquinone biosynthesis C-methylase UbiE
MIYNKMFIWVYQRFIDPMLRDVRTYTPEFAGMKEGDRVLDVCCGTGDQALHYAGRGIDAVGIDIDLGMIKVAARNRVKRGLGNASFQAGDAQNLPFSDDSFDFVSVSLALHEKGRPERDRVISEMKRVVKREGTLVFIDFPVPLPRNPYGLLVRVAELFAGRDHFRCSRDYFEQGGLDVLLRKHGLHEEKRRYLKYGVMVIAKARSQQQ